MGEYYDLTVPAVGHYAAQGLWHHNSGKTAAGVIKTLERIRRSMSGIFVSPDLPHFKRSLWPEFTRWCPWPMVIDREQYRGRFGWEPNAPFTLNFKNGASLICGGIEEPGAWEGPNVSFCHFDEARRAKNANALKVLTGRARIPGPQGEPPQVYLTTTPQMHWLFDYFGPVQRDPDGKVDDPLAAFKADQLVVTLLTADNAAHLTPGFVEKRAQGLTEAERRVLLEAQWEDIESGERFLPSLTWWDACRENVPALDRNTPLVVGVDAGISNDYFAVVGVSRHPAHPKDGVLVRLVRVWEPKGRALNFDLIETEIRETILKPYNVKQIAYDAYQLHQMMTRLGAVTWTRAFDQTKERLLADKGLLDLITAKRIGHDGQADLRRALEHADRKTDLEDHSKLRMVKRADHLHIDAAVALSMAAYEALRLNL